MSTLIYDFLISRNEKVLLTEIATPPNTWNGPLNVMEEVLKHEEYVTASIHTIYDEAFQVKDFRTMQFLDWFIKEQGEEEKNSEDNIKKYDLFAGDSKGLYMLDSELKTRLYAAPSLILD